MHPAISLSGYFILVSDASSGRNQAHQTHEGVIFVLLLATSTVVLVSLKLLAHAAVIPHRGRVARHDSMGTYHQARGLLTKWVAYLLLIGVDCLLGDNPARRPIGVSAWRGIMQTRQT